LSAQDEILAFDGKRVDQRSIQGALDARKPGDTVKVLYSRRGGIIEAEVVLEVKAEPRFKIAPLASPSDGQRALLDSWLK